MISSNAHDKVFVYYADHGAPGILGMPTGPFLYGKDLVDTLIEKANDHGFMVRIVTMHMVDVELEYRHSMLLTLMTWTASVVFGLKFVIAKEFSRTANDSDTGLS